MNDNKRDFMLAVCGVDFETTGLDVNTCEIIEFGLSTRFDNTWTMVSQLCKPSDPIEPEISAITNIVDEMVVDKPPFDAHLMVFDALQDEYSCFVAHNAEYDSNILNHYKQYAIPWICTLRLTKKLYASDDTVKQLNLAYLRYRFKLDLNNAGDLHRAGFDAYVTMELLSYLIEVMENAKLIDVEQEYLPQVLEFLEEDIITHVMTFGTHKDKLMVDVPMSYWKWALDNLVQLDENDDAYDRDFAASVANAISIIMDY